MVHLSTSRSGLACAQFDAIERAFEDSATRVLAAFNLGVAAATAGELSRAEAAFTRALATLTTAGSPRDIHKVRFDVPFRPGGDHLALPAMMSWGERRKSGTNVLFKLEFVTLV